MATKMKMVSKGGKMVPDFAADGKGKMKMGGSTKKKMGMGGMHTMPDGSMMSDAAMRPPMKKGGATKLKKAMYGSTMKPAMKKGGPVKKMQGGGYANTTPGQIASYPPMKKGGTKKK